MASKWNLIVDVARCDNCRVCFLAVKDEYVGNDFPGYSAAQPAQGHNWLGHPPKGAGRLSARRSALHARHVQPLRRRPVPEGGARRGCTQAP